MYVYVCVFAFSLILRRFAIQTSKFIISVILKMINDYTTIKLMIIPPFFVIVGKALSHFTFPVITLCKFLHLFNFDISNV